MKNLFMLYLLVISPQLTAQNSAMEFNNNAINNPRSTALYLEKLSAKNLFPASLEPENYQADELLIGTERSPLYSSPEDFSSFTLIAQLEKLNHSTPLHVVHNPTLERFIRIYLQDRKDYLDRMLSKSLYYFPVLEQYLDAAELPLELKYLAVVESALNPVAVSSSGAKGLWQFMYGTGQEYDLRIDSYIDERFDFLKSTEAACNYLKKLYDMFGDWDLALAAYNAGPGNVQKAIKRAGGNTNYWEIRQYLPKETSSYVPAFYATMYLFTHADYHNLKTGPADISYFETDTVHVSFDLNFETVSEKTGIGIDLLKSFNPQYKGGVIPGIHHKSLSLTLPLQLMSKYIAAEKLLYSNGPAIKNESLTAGVLALTMKNSYLVKNGDNLNSIAQKHGISLEKLKKWNGLDTNFLIAGQRLVVTDKKVIEKGPIADPAAMNITKYPTRSDVVDYVTYKVEFGDTLFKISRKFGNISISELRSINDLQDVNYLKPGTLLKLRTTIPNGSVQMANKS